MVSNNQLPPGSGSGKQWIPLAVRAYPVVAFTLLSFTVMIVVVFPKPSMAEHLNNTIQRVTFDIVRVAILSLLLFGGLICWHPEVRTNGRFWLSVAICTLFVFWLL